MLILAHVYSAIVGEVGAEGQWLSHAERHVLIVDNIPVLAAIVVPSLLMMVAGAGLISLDLAIDLSIVLSVAGLFSLGAYQARGSGARAGVQVGVGALGGAVGIAVIALEAEKRLTGESSPITRFGVSSSSSGPFPLVWPIARSRTTWPERRTQSWIAG